MSFVVQFVLYILSQVIFCFGAVDEEITNRMQTDSVLCLHEQILAHPSLVPLKHSPLISVVL